MPAIIYQKDPSALIPQGDRTVSTFPSGLVRVDQSFIGRTDLNASHRSQLVVGADFPGDQQPSYDGLRIFPEVQEKRLPDGFTEYLVSAYGRTTINVYNIVFDDIRQNIRTGLAQKYRTLTQKYVFANGEAQNKPLEIDSLIEEILISNPEAELVEGQGYSGYKVYTKPYTWYSLNVSFLGTGQVDVITNRISETITGTSIDKITSKFYDVANGGVSTSGNAEDDFYVIPYGNVSGLKVTQFKDLSYSKITKSSWVGDIAELVNYGHFNEVTAKFRSLPSYLQTA